eukprot:2249052-Amphidinium_carterae.1
MVLKEFAIDKICRGKVVPAVKIGSKWSAGSRLPSRIRQKEARAHQTALSDAGQRSRLLTKPVAANVAKRHLASLGFEYRTTWSQLR